jgi:hypothetical protein
MPLAEERQILKEISRMERAKKLVEEYSVTDQQIQNMKVSFCVVVIEREKKRDLASVSFCLCLF